jgi:hypothetical protein
MAHRSWWNRQVIIAITEDFSVLSAQCSVASRETEREREIGAGEHPSLMVLSLSLSLLLLLLETTTNLKPNPLSAFPVLSQPTPGVAARGSICVVAQGQDLHPPVAPLSSFLAHPSGSGFGG